MQLKDALFDFFETARQALLKRSSSGSSSSTTLLQYPRTGPDIPPVQSLEVKAEDVRGQVDITLKAEIDSSGIAKFVDEVRRLTADLSGKQRTIGSNGPGSTGRSSPDAQAPGGTGFGAGGM